MRRSCHGAVEHGGGVPAGRPGRLDGRLGQGDGERRTRHRGDAEETHDPRRHQLFGFLDQI
jgi:hypothetical protein